MDPPNRILKDGACLIEDDRIVSIGDTQTVRPQAAAPEYRIDARNSLLLPGLIDAHVHTGNSLSRGIIPPDVAYREWISDWMLPYKSLVTRGEGKVAAQFCLLEMIRTGTTCYLDSLIYSRHGYESIAEAVVEAGVRACLAKFVTNVPRLEKMEGSGEEDSIREARQLHSRLNGAGQGRVEVWLEPPPLGTGSRSFYEEASTLARELKTGLTIHFLESKEDKERLLAQGLAPGRFAMETGLLGPRSVLAHAIWVSDDDIEAITQAEASVAHCPTTNLKLLDGLAPIAKMAHKGVNVALGCDGFSSNDNVDIFREMRTATILHRTLTMDPAALSSLEALRMGTIYGARALGKARTIGSLEEGKKADMIVVDMKRPYSSVKRDPVGHLIHTCSSGEVKHVIVDGKFIMQDQRILTMNEERIHEEVERTAQDLGRRVDARRSPTGGPVQ